MSAYSPERIYAAVRLLLPTLDEELRQKVQDLLAQAEQGADTHMQILELLTADEDTRKRLNELLKEKGDRLMGYEGPGGEPYVTKPGDVYACPMCDYRYVIGEAGEKPLPCPRHPDVKLIKLTKEG